MNAIDAAIDFGLDMTLVEESLKLTPEQRAIQHQRALEMALQLQVAYGAREIESRNGRTQSIAADAVRR